MAERQFPIHPCDRAKLQYVPWSFVEPHEQRAQRNHSQTLQRLSERGGLSLCELLALVTDREYYDVPQTERDDAEARVRALLAATR